MFKKYLLVLTGIVFALSACGSAATPMANSARSREDADSGVMIPAIVPGSTTGYTYSESGAGQAGNIPQADRLVIKNADLRIVVRDPEASSQAIGAMAEEMGGYVVSANLYQTTLTGGKSVPQASISIRIPAEQLNKALESIKAQSKEDALSENISSQDVTADYTDLQSRLRNAEAAEAKLAQIMEDTSKTEDTLNVFAQLKAVREEIELLKGQIQYYEQSAAFSLISVELVAEESIQPIEIGGWEPKGVARDAIQSLVNAMQFFASAAIWLILFCAPVMLVLGIPLAIIIGGIRFAAQKTRKQPKPKPVLPSIPPHDAPVA